MTHPKKRHEPPIFFHLKWMAKIAMSVSVVASATLLLVLFVITGESGTLYSQIVHANSVTHANLAWVTLVFGLALALLAGLIAWLISLYASHRVAGPLYRFSRNLDNAIEHPVNAPVAIRHSDLLQSEAQAFEASLARLAEHHRNLREKLEDVKRSMPADAASDLQSLRVAVTRLAEIERLVRL